MNLKDFGFSIDYKIGAYKFRAETENEHFALKISENSNENFLKLEIIPKQKIELLAVSLSYKYVYDEGAVVFTNGYQSWTTSKEHKKTDRQYGLRGLCNLGAIKKIAGATGDYMFKNYAKVAGAFHSYTYGYIRSGMRVDLIGSLTDRTGWTIINFDMNHDRVRIEKDVEGLSPASAYTLFEIVRITGGYDEVFDKYFAAMEIAPPRISHMSGYTSWYNYFQKIDESIILRDLKGLSRVGDKADIFQIDDGYETLVGDWLTPNPEKFPRGLKPIVDDVHVLGYKAGLWLAPFSAEYKSQVLKDHPDWTIKNKKGKPIVAGIAWGGFYALDFYIPECAAYIKSCFDKVFDEWGFDMVKLDFLYGACMVPRNNKTRGQIMYEAVDFLRECCRDKLILGCGVPMAPAFGKFELCRISCDAELSFKEKFYAKITNQEIISTKNAMNNTIFRRHLDGRAFVNDPDVFFLRDENAKYSWTQKEILAKINNMFGNILFVSDDIGTYDDKKLQLLLKTYKKSDAQIISAEYLNNNIIQIVFKQGDTKKLIFNTLTGEYSEKVLEAKEK